MRKPSQSSVEQDIADRDWWNELGALLGWRVLGWTRRNSATFITSPDGESIVYLELWGFQRDAIMVAIDAARKEPGR
jgi:hypothetical protein